MEEKNEKKTENKGIKIVKSILNTIINILIVLVLIVSILVAVMALTSKATGISTVFGWTVQTIQSDSMKGASPDGYEGGDFEKGDLVIGRATNFDELAEYQVGDIITYKGKDDEGQPYLMAHRIINRVEGSDGYYRYQTQGDNREVSEVPDQQDEGDYLAAYDIASVVYSDDYHAWVIKGFGNTLDYIRQPQGFFLIVLIPMIIFFLYALFRVALSAANYKKAKSNEEKDKIEKEKKEAVEAAVKAVLEAKEAQAQTAAPAAAAPSAGVTAEQMEQFKQFLAFQQMQNAAADEAEAAPEAPAPEEE